MSGFIKHLKNPFTGNTIFPVTKTRAVYNQDGTRLDKYIDGLRGSASNNLLINGNFANPINQRGKTLATANGYFIDRWQFGAQNNEVSCTVDSGYIGIDVGAGVSNGVYFAQDIEFPEKYVGKSMAFSMKYRANGNSADVSKCHMFLQITLGSGTNVTQSLGNFTLDGAWNILKKVVTIPNEVITRLRVGIGIGYNMSSSEFSSITSATMSNNFDIDIEWVKAELGEVATAYVPRLYQDEWQLCQRYYREIACIVNMVTYSANTLIFYIDAIKGMRTTPSATFKSSEFNSGNGAYLSNISNSMQTGFIFELSIGQQSNTVRCIATKTSHGLTNGVFVATSGNKICLDAEM